MQPAGCVTASGGSAKEPAGFAARVPGFAARCGLNAGSRLFAIPAAAAAIVANPTAAASAAFAVQVPAVALEREETDRREDRTGGPQPPARGRDRQLGLTTPPPHSVHSDRQPVQ